MAPFPLFKLGALLAKQISKPLSRIIKEKATHNPFLKDYVVVPVAQVYHRFDISIRMRLLGLGNPDKVQPLTEKQAIELGAEMLGDFFVFGTAAGAILLEYWRQSSNKAAKDQQVANKVDNLGNASHEIITKVEANTKMVEEIVKQFQDLHKKVQELEKLSKVKSNGQSTQTVVGERPVGKIMYPSNSEVKASSDVRNSIVYQSADNAVFALTNKTISS